MLTYAILRGFLVKKDFQDGTMVMPAGQHILKLDSDIHPLSAFLTPGKTMRLREMKQYERQGLLTLTPSYFVYTAAGSNRREVLDFAAEARTIVQELIDLFFKDRGALRRRVTVQYALRPDLPLREIMIRHIVQSNFPEGKKVLSPCGVDGQFGPGRDRLMISAVSNWSLPPKGQGWQGYMDQHNETIPVVNQMVELWLNSKE